MYLKFGPSNPLTNGESILITNQPNQPYSVEAEIFEKDKKGKPRGNVNVYWYTDTRKTPQQAFCPKGVLPILKPGDSGTLKVNHWLDGKDVDKWVIKLQINKDIVVKPEEPASDSDEGKVDEVPPMNPLLRITGVCEVNSLPPLTPVTSEYWEGTKPAAEALVLIGIDSIREWWSIGVNQALWSIPNWDYVRQYIKAGVKSVSLCVNWAGKVLPTPDQVTFDVKWVLSKIPADILPYIDLWEVGNEPAYGEYWKEVGENKNRTVEECLKNYVSLFFKPAKAVLKEAGQKVGNAGLNGSFGTHYKIIKDAGCDPDVLIIHPYSKTKKELKTKYDELKKNNVNPTLPVEEGESNAFIGQDYKKGLKTVKQAEAEILDQNSIKPDYGVQRKYYFMSYRCEDSQTGPLGLLIPTPAISKPNKAKIVSCVTGPFYTTIKQLNEQKK